MSPLYEKYLFSDPSHKDLVMREIIGLLEKSVQRIDELEQKIARLEVKHNPLAGLSRSFDIVAKVKQAEVGGM